MNNNNILNIEIDAARLFLSLIDESTKTFCFQTFNDDKEESKKSLARTLHGSIDELSKTLGSINRQGGGVFVAVNEITGQRRTSKNVGRIRAVFADFDNEASPVTDSPIHPHIRVRSSQRGEHWYWLVDGMTKEEFVEAQTRIAARLNGDPKVKDPPRVMRLPGFYHMKDPTNPQIVELIECNPSGAYQPDEIFEAFPPVEAPQVPSTTPIPANQSHLDRYATRAFDSAIAAIATAREGERNDTLNREAFGLAGLAKAGRIDWNSAAAALGNAARGVGLADGEIRTTLNSALQSAEPRYQQEQQVSIQLLKQKPVNDDTVTAAELVDKEFPPIEWIVHGLLPEGLSLLAGSPKIGKSWLALDICLSVSRGMQVLGADTEQGDALYLALEDTPRRLKRRLLALLNGNPAPTNLHLTTQWPQADDGAKKLGDWLDQHQKCRLVVVDTLARYRGKADGAKGLYQQDYDDVLPLLEIAGGYGVAVLLIHHTRKLESDDALHLVSGTQGLTGGCDGIWVMKRNRGTGGAELFVTGRDIEDEQTYAIAWDKDVKRWFVTGAGQEALLSPQAKKILDIVREHGPITGRDIATVIHPGTNITRESKEYRAIRRQLAKMSDQGLIENAKGGWRVL